MARLVLYQNAYDAAAKLMTVFDEMMQTLIATMD
jgi:flagellar hook-associated protein FlgK